MKGFLPKLDLKTTVVGTFIVAASTVGYLENIVGKTNLSNKLHVAYQNARMEHNTEKRKPAFSREEALDYLYGCALKYRESSIPEHDEHGLPLKYMIDIAISNAIDGSRDRILTQSDTSRMNALHTVYKFRQEQQD